MFNRFTRLDQLNSPIIALFISQGLMLLLAVTVSQTRMASSSAAEKAAKQPLDPAAWGSDHVGQPRPLFVSGDECLFCHRKDIAPTWQENRHFLTTRRAEEIDPALKLLQENPQTAKYAEQVDFLLGGNRHVHYLRKTPNYGRLDLLSASYERRNSSTEQSLSGIAQPKWDDKAFGKSCAGCHTSGFDAKTAAFSDISLDCYTCHGDVQLEHSKREAEVLLGDRKRGSARVVVSLCGQCHLRSGKSQSTGLPFPNNFVAGDNLFRDLNVDLSEKHLSQLGPIERHILQSTRDVVVFGEEQTSCVTCHDVHDSSTVKHQQLDASTVCWTCHFENGPRSKTKPRETHNALCGY